MYDVVIVGAGVSGCCSARELSRYDLNILVIDKEEDVCCGTSKANSAIAHAGFDAEPGSLMAKLNVEGNLMMEELSKELDFPFKKIGSLVVCTDEKDMDHLKALMEQGIKNGVPDLRIVYRDELAAMEPNIADSAVAALYAPSAGVVCPFNLTFAMAENACTNGVKFQFDTAVEDIVKEENGFTIKTNQGEIKTRMIVNAAGVYADVLHNMVSDKKLTIVARKGEYNLLDRSVGDHVSHTIFMLPNAMGKGVLVTPTVHGNLLVGPTALDIEDKEGVNTTRAGLDEVACKSALTVKNVPLRQVITSFAGLRAHEAGHEFIIEEVSDAPGFIDCAGIESPGLTASPAIGRMVAGIVSEKLAAKAKDNFVAERKGILNPNTLSIEERNELVHQNPAYGTIVCRCETVTEGEIIDAIHRNPGARSLDGVKRRTRAGMGRCQAGFCSPKTMEILAREIPGMTLAAVTKAGGSSRLIVGDDKEWLVEES